MTEGRLSVCGTPIGNLGDVSERLIQILSEADVVYAEDTRRTSKLLSHVGAKPRLRSLFVGNERERTADLLSDISSGQRVVLVSDAGMPTVSDPGANAVREAREAGFLVTVVPGPSAVTTAVTASVGAFHQAVHSLRDQEQPITLFEFWIGADSVVPVARTISSASSTPK